MGRKKENNYFDMFIQAVTYSCQAADMLKEKGIDFSYPFCLGSTNAPEQAEGLREIMWNQLADKNCECLEIGGTVGVHAGPNCAGLGCFLAEPQDK